MRRDVYSPAHRTETRRRPLEITHPRIEAKSLRRVLDSASTSSVCSPRRRRRTWLPRRAVEVGRCGDHRYAASSIRHVDDAARGVKLLVGDDVFDRVDRRPEEVRFAGEDLGPLVQRLGREDLIQLTDELDGVDGAGPRSREPRIAEPLGPCRRRGTAGASAGRPPARRSRTGGRRRSRNCSCTGCPSSRACRSRSADPTSGSVQVEADGVGALPLERGADQLPLPGARPGRPARRRRPRRASYRRSGRPSRRAGTAASHRGGSAGARARRGPRTRRCRRRRDRRPARSRRSR